MANQPGEIQVSVQDAPYEGGGTIDQTVLEDPSCTEHKHKELGIVLRRP